MRAQTRHALAISLSIGLCCAVAISLAPPVAADNAADAVGLSLFFQNGGMTPLTLSGSNPRYLQEIDIATITDRVTFDQGATPIIGHPDFASLDWRGLRQVEEDWRQPGGAGPFTRQRFYRGANWMEQPSTFLVFPTNNNGLPVGLPLLALAGIDNKALPSDDGFIRRFVVRQIAENCPAKDNCTGATYRAQILVQWRAQLNPTQRAIPIPAAATQLRLFWTQQPSKIRTVNVQQAAASASPYGYGFQMSLDRINAPANAQFYTAGETLRYRVTFRDGAGNRLHPQGSLPTYNQFLANQIPSGLRYFDGFRLEPTLYYGLKHRESNLIVTMVGPTDRLKIPTKVLQIPELLNPAAESVSASVDGYTALFAGIPPFGVSFGGPPFWDTPITDVVEFKLPGDVKPGTYALAMKARREWGGEALNRAATAEVQVGTAAPTPFVPTTGPCNTCHTGESQLGKILHGLSDRRACNGCHAPLSFEPDGPIDIRIHTIHSRSQRYPANFQECSKCHLTTPSGPARGYLAPQ